MSKLTAGTIIRARITVKIPKDATEEEVLRWLQFQLGIAGGIRCANPLSKDDLKAHSLTILP